MFEFLKYSIFTLFHGTSGFLITFLLSESGFLEVSVPVMASAFLFSMLPDLDILTARTVRDHHRSLFHAPGFWIVISSIVSIFNSVLGVRLLLHTFFHLFNDYLCARTTGVFFFYPFRENEYSLFQIKSRKEISQ
ncbi:MAG: metal-dependent hydrolase [Candidatus Nanohaloarchaea archaeon]